MNNQNSVTQNTDNNNIEDSLGLDEIFKPVLQRFWKILALSFFVSFLVFFYLSLLKPSFQATATLQIGSTKPSTTLSIKDAFNESNVSSVQIETQFELLKSRQFAAKVIEKLNLLETDEFFNNKYRDSVDFLNGARTEQKVLLESAISTFQQRLLIKPVVKTELVKISYTTYSPERAKK